MADEEDEDFEEESEEPEDLEDPDLDELSENDLVEDDDALDDEDALVDEEEEEPAAVEGAPVKAKTSDDDDEEEDEDDDEVDPDDVEASLDVILKDRLVVEDEEEDEDEPDVEDRTEGPTKVQPKRPDEFVCQSCFLVKHPSQLADAKRQLCRDCV